jgi:hypothetical protein
MNVHCAAKWQKTLIGKKNFLGYTILDIKNKGVKLKKKNRFHDKIVE